MESTIQVIHRLWPAPCTKNAVIIHDDCVNIELSVLASWSVIATRKDSRIRRGTSEYPHESNQGGLEHNGKKIRDRPLPTVPSAEI